MMRFNTLKRLGGILAVLVISGCGSTPHILETSIFYRRDLPVRVVYDAPPVGSDIFPTAGEQFEGSAVLKKADHYTFLITPKGGAKMDLLTITTCHREFGGEKLSPGWFKKNQFKYEFTPVPGIEDVPSCLLRMNILDADKGKHAWAVFDVQDDLTNLAATLTCNGKVIESEGVSICQTRMGLIQRLVFNEDIKLVADACFIEEPQGNVLEYKTQKGECVFAILGLDSGQFHRLTTIGYEQIPIRETD